MYRIREWEITVMRPRIADWPALVEEFQGSGLTQKAFCKQKNLREATFGIWLRKLRAQQPAQPASTGFIELDVLSNVARRVREGREGDLVVELPLGVILRFHGVRK